MNTHDYFNNSKYTRWYWDIVTKRKHTPASKSQYREHHHIVPESFYINRSRDGAPGWLEGNADSRSNMVWLTGREHALCHWLLTKMTAHDTRAYELMVYSFNMMKVGGDHQDREVSRMITRAYERNKLEWSRIHSQRMKGHTPWNKGRKEDRPEILQRMKDAAAVRETDPVKQAEGQKKRIAKVTGQKRTDETKKRQSEGVKKYYEENPRGSWSDEERMKRSITQTGVPKHEGHGAKVAAANRGVVSINKDGVEKKIKRDDLQQWLDQGWQKGGRPRVDQQGKKRGPYKNRAK